MRRIAATTLTLAALIELGCGDPAEPSAGAASLEVTPDTVVAQRSPQGWSTFTVTATLRNTSERIATLVCARNLEHEQAERWVPAWTSICTMSAGAEVAIAPGEARSIGLAVTTGFGNWTGSVVPGRYRMVQGVLFSGAEHSEAIVSNAFTVRY